MLFLNGEQFTAGRAKYADSNPGRPEPTAKIYVTIEPEGFPLEVVAQLDTGAAWSILLPEIAEHLGLFNKVGEPARLDTRGGRYEGRLVDTRLTLLANEGESLDVDAIVFVSPTWTLVLLCQIRGIVPGSACTCDPSTCTFS